VSLNSFLIWNCCKTKRKIARVHYRIACKRADYLHKMTTWIAKRYKLIGVENLHVVGMVKNRRLARSLSDASFGEILRQLEYKAKWFGGKVQRVGRFFASSKTCHYYNYVHQTLTLCERKWTCEGCNTTRDRDLNASKNIEQEALRLAR
ncbi:MAG: RNA-guided endonuclease TnpB family protein, partial [Chloroflexota bacterium]